MGLKEAKICDFDGLKMLIFLHHKNKDSKDSIRKFANTSDQVMIADRKNLSGIVPDLDWSGITMLYTVQ